MSNQQSDLRDDIDWLIEDQQKDFTEVRGDSKEFLEFLDRKSQSRLQVIDFQAMKKLERIRKDIDDFHERLEEEIKKAEERHDFDFTKGAIRVQILRDRKTEEYILFFILSHMIIEKYSIRLLKRTVIDEDYRQSSKTDKMLQRRFSQEEREQLLLRSGVVDSGLVGEMQRLREIRNRLSHDISENLLNQYIERDNSDFDRALNVASKLIEKFASTFDDDEITRY